jgi:hypothetical protein
MDKVEKQQKEICLKFGSSFIASKENEKVGIALNTIEQQPLNALRHNPENNTCGWYIWGGEEMSQDPEFFQPLHVSHLKDKCPEIVKYLGLSPGWRVLVAGEYEDVWYDEGLLNEKA